MHVARRRLRAGAPVDRVLPGRLGGRASRGVRPCRVARDRARHGRRRLRRRGGAGPPAGDGRLRRHRGRPGMSVLSPGALPAELVPGEPDEVERLAARLTRFAAGAGEAAARLDALSRGAWSGEAGELFREAVGEVPASADPGGDRVRLRRPRADGVRTDAARGAGGRRPRGPAGRAVDPGVRARPTSRPRPGWWPARAPRSRRPAGSPPPGCPRPPRTHRRPVPPRPAGRSPPASRCGWSSSTSSPIRTASSHRPATGPGRWPTLRFTDAARRRLRRVGPGRRGRPRRPGSLGELGRRGHRPPPRRRRAGRARGARRHRRRPHRRSAGAAARTPRWTWWAWTRPSCAGAGRSSAGLGTATARSPRRGSAGCSTADAWRTRLASTPRPGGTVQHRTGPGADPLRRARASGERVGSVDRDVRGAVLRTGRPAHEGA